jgi:hypothetical protein
MCIWSNPILHIIQGEQAAKRGTHNGTGGRHEHHLHKETQEKII